MPMQIKDLFVRDLFRAINGVVKADQQDEAIVWQELDEYVVTRELDKHFRRFFDVYLSAMDNPHDPVIASRMGVWVSGFFGSGKSHFIKILSYLLKNQRAFNQDTSQHKDAIEFFKEKITDSMLLSDMKRSATGKTDVILFNIDSKADNKDGKDAILSVFVRVFNEMQGFSGDAPHIAWIERYLKEKDLLGKFCDSFKRISGDDWAGARDAYLLMRDEIIQAISETLGKTGESAVKWFDEAESKFKMNIEGFAGLIKEYLDSRGPDHRIVFLVDEAGQFIGTDTHLMLNLQTITEDLGRICNGRAWVIVTAQEDIDAILKDVRGSKANDFSKIQGRFFTRLSLSSANTDEVIQTRLLEKKDDARSELKGIYEQKGDILKNQLSFSNNGATLKTFRDADDFVANYPFAPYHFQLLQKVFESIRKAGATGKHLAMGERSMLDAFQSAAISISMQNTGGLIPFYEFYPAIESFLDTVIRRTIEQARLNTSLEPFDVKLLCILFLIRYVEIMKSNVSNLVTLCISEVDTDRLALKGAVEEALQRLEKETLISRNGDRYFYLTDEEQVVSREIRNTDTSGSEELKILSDLVYQDVLKDDSKCRYQLNKKDYGFNRICDGQPNGRVDDELSVEMVTPFNDSYPDFVPQKCILQSSGRSLIKLPENKDFGREFQLYVRTNKYIRLKSTAAAPETLKTILNNRAEENRERKNRLIASLESMILEGDYFVDGQSFQQKATTPRVALSNTVTNLIQNLYTKLGYIDTPNEEPQKEIRALLTAYDIGQYTLKFDVTESNSQALKEMKEFVDLSMVKNQTIFLNELVDRFSKRPYGWHEFEVVLLVTRLFLAGEVLLMLDGAAVLPKDAIEALIKSVRWKQVKIIKKKAVDTRDLEISRKLGQALFGQIGPETQDSLNAFLRDRLTDWANMLSGYQSLADTNNYPGKREIEDGCILVGKLLAIADSFEFLQAFNTKKGELSDLSNDVHDLKDFYTNQRATWDKLREAMTAFSPNRQELEKDPSAKEALTRMGQILSAQSPYKMIKEIEGLIVTVKTVNAAMLVKRKEDHTLSIDNKIEMVMDALQQYKAEPDLRNKALKPLQDIKKHIQDEESIPGIFYQGSMAEDELEKSLDTIETTMKQKEDKKTPPKPVRYIQPAKVTVKNYLETEEDVKEFIEALRKELEAALQEHVRIRIQ
jgi:hypothetical protein